MKTALVYDRVNKWGGAERVLLALHELFPDAPLYTSVYSKESAKWAKVFPKVIPSFLQDIPLAKSNHEKLAFLMPLAFELLDFSEYDLVISVTSESAKGIITKPKTKHICYCLTPTRYLWSGHGEYFSNSINRIATKPIVNYLKRWDRMASQRPDIMIAISTVVQQRIKTFYGRESGIIYPPAKSPQNIDHRPQALDYYLLVSRLVKYKKVDLAIKTFNKLGKKLFIVGTGKEEKSLRSIAHTNITFTGLISDKELAEYYRNCKALIMPQFEDFGLVAVEAQQYGKPVIAYGKGGALDTVIDNETGVLFNNQTEESLIDAVNKFEKIKFKQVIIKNNAQRFSKERFNKEFMQLVNKYV